MEKKTNYGEESIKLHRKLRGKISVVPNLEIKTMNDLSLAYTPGVAAPCLEIQKDITQSFELTSRWNTVAVVTDGSAVLGLGDIGPEAGMPVMEGKCVLFKTFAGVNAFPLCIRSKNVDDIVKTVTLLAGSFGGINLEDIAAPRCFEIERRLKESCDIPVFHDDQHGTAIVTLAALINSLKIVGKRMSNIKVVINGAGAAGNAIARILLSAGVKNIIVCDRSGVISQNRDNLDSEKHALSLITNLDNIGGSLSEVMNGADVFIGVSSPGCVTQEMVKSMAKDAILFTMANPTPEIMPEAAKQAGARIIGTGRSDYPNQINNVLAFPAVFRGALDARAADINEEMKLSAAFAISRLVSDHTLSENYIIPTVFDIRIKDAVSKAVAEAAVRSGVSRKR